MYRTVPLPPPPAPTLRPQARPLLTALLLMASMAVSAQDFKFEIFRSGDKVGNIFTSRSISAGSTSYLITSHAELNVIWKQVVRTRLGAEYSGGILTSCRSTLQLNGNMRDSSEMYTHGGRSIAYVHPAAPFLLPRTNEWTTSRMFYEEPLGQSSVLVESVMQACPLVRTGPGVYELTLPNNDRNRYLYVGGRLMEVQVDRLLVNLVFRRA
ncbi:MAG: hypothetical protein K8H89_03850 [Flavobacteriales bacterium]|nr:hypothetical protein [Flavobacteriales bacterium]